MKRHIVFLSFTIIMAVMIMLSGCRSTRVVKMPCFGEDYRSTSEHIRAFQTASGADKSTIIRVANLRARQALAQNFKSVMESATEEYLRLVAGRTSQDQLSKFRDYALNYTAVELTNISVICEEMHEKRRGGYEYFVAIQTDNNNILRNFERGLREEELELEYDRHLFRQIYEDKIEEYKNRQN